MEYTEICWCIDDAVRSTKRGFVLKHANLCGSGARLKRGDDFWTQTGEEEYRKDFCFAPPSFLYDFSCSGDHVSPSGGMNGNELDIVCECNPCVFFHRIDGVAVFSIEHDGAKGAQGFNHPWKTKFENCRVHLETPNFSLGSFCQFLHLMKRQTFEIEDDPLVRQEIHVHRVSSV